jgi:hypothetical protein
MNTNILETKFARIGARLKCSAGSSPHCFTRGGPITLDVQNDRNCEYCEITLRARTDADVEVLDVQPADRHLLLMVRENGGKHKFLCGHDERHWFVAAIPEAAPVGTVAAAKEALKPAEVQATQARLGIGAKQRNRRKNAAYYRQGEWFFLPVPDLRVDQALVLRNEPITRGNGSKPHWAEWCFRTGERPFMSVPGTPTGSMGRDTAGSWNTTSKPILGPGGS